MNRKKGIRILALLLAGLMLLSVAGAAIWNVILHA
jgi:hypothetical protein